ncbi:unnamed protein product [Rotaria magnacalcarata]|uniref:F-box domain-containing protein n=5 Tax=Rotaria magnacalcarata TaxID=392030 RepID=A0A8S2SUR3_9BILA|nr:unnamed protein product [Rotaria magnacalcarata]
MPKRQITALYGRKRYKTVVYVAIYGRLRPFTIVSGRRNVRPGSEAQENMTQTRINFNAFLTNIGMILSKTMSLDTMPHNILYHLCEYLSFMDILNTLKTCKRLYMLIETDNYFWSRMIKSQVGPKLYQRYVYEIFQNPKNSDYSLYRTEKDKEQFAKRLQNHEPKNVCGLWLLNMLNCKDNNDGYIAYRSIVHQKLRPRTNEIKMSLTIEEFIESYLNRTKTLTKENIYQISLYKLIYYYLIEPKRLLGVDIFGINLYCSKDHIRCANSIITTQEYDSKCLTGRCVRLYSNSADYQAGIKGKFKSFLPGIYEIICCIKLDKNDKYLSYYNQECIKDDRIKNSVECYFYALADHGLDCECGHEKLNYDWFESNYMLHGNSNWFNETMGKIQVFELSDVYFGFDIKRDYCYRNILLDYIELNIVE